MVPAAPVFHFSTWLLAQKAKCRLYGLRTLRDPVFARLPSKQEICYSNSHEQAPVTIFLADSVRIEVAANCPSEVMASLVSTIKSYA